MFTEPDTISLFCLLMYMYFLFVLLTPLCPYYVCSNPIMIIFSVDGHHLAFLYIVSFAISTKNVNTNLSGNLYGATYFFPRSLRSLGI